MFYIFLLIYKDKTQNLLKSDNDSDFQNQKLLKDIHKAGKNDPWRSKQHFFLKNLLGTEKATSTSLHEVKGATIEVKGKGKYEYTGTVNSKTQMV